MTAAFAAEPLTRHTLKIAPGEIGAPARLADFNWLVGHWSGTGLDGISEEQWSAPEGGAMMGMYRLLKDGRVAFYEFLTLGKSGDSLLLTLRHFHPDLRGWEERDETVRLPFIKAAAGRFYFDGLTMEPRDDALTIFLAVEGTESKDDSVREVAFSYQRH